MSPGNLNCIHCNALVINLHANMTMKDSQTICKMFFALLFISGLLKATNGQGSLSVAFPDYKEKDASDKTTKCIELCVTVPPFQFPHCNFTHVEKLTYGRTSFYFASRGIRFYFNDVWKDNTALTATVWRLEGKQSCKRPTNCTHHGDAGIIIPYHVTTAISDVIESNKWKLTVTTLLQCKKCRKNCIPRDNSTGHYTCNEGNKRCMKNWFGEECATFCNTNASNYRCDEHGRKTCLPNWFNNDCDQFCDSSLGNYVCDETGRRVCFLHRYGKNCTKYCNNSAKKYKCNDNGERVCSRNWYGQNCSTFCDSNNEAFKCSLNGVKVCLKNWFGKDCSKYCNGSDMRYKCNAEGEKMCLKNWYGQNCSKFCDSDNEAFKCSLNGDKICLKNWFGKDCSKYCNGSDMRYKCNDEGEKMCLKNWYGHDCLKFCDSNNEAFKCSLNGDKICLKNWFGNDCSKYCNGSDARYKCNDEGERVCLNNWYGENCARFCNSSEVRYRCDTKGERICAENWFGKECNYKQIALSSEVYYFEFQKGINGIYLRCPESMQNTYCLESCENISDTVGKYKSNCVSCNARGCTAFFCINTKNRNNICTYVQGTLGELKKDDQSPDDKPLYLGMIGGLYLMIVLIVILAVLWHRKNKKVATQSPDYEEPDEIRRELFARKYNRAELTLNADELMKRRQTNTEELGYENKGMMVEIPLYDSNRRMRAAPSFRKIDSSDDVLAMRNIAI